MEFISPEGLRLDGRRPHEMRQLHAEVGVVAKADGSALFEMGNTKVIAAVYGPHEVQIHSQQLHDQALVILLTSLLFYLYFPVLHYCVFVNDHSSTVVLPLFGILGFRIYVLDVSSICNLAASSSGTV
jgi:hypothetical protein